MRSCLYQGSLSHHRGGAVKNNFTYRLYTACIDLDDLGELDRKLRLFSLDRTNAFALRGTDYALTSGITRPSERRQTTLSLKQRALDVFRQAETSSAASRIELITQFRVAGFVFNPVSFFVAYNNNDELVAAIAEINNTYDQTYAYVLDDRCREPSVADAVFATNKDFFVSPFIGDDCRYEWRFPARRASSELDVRMKLSRPVGGAFFASRLRGERRELSDVALLRSLVRFPLMPTQIWLRIHYQALRLRVLGLQYRRPLSP